jgi:hypothetical protein
MQKVISATANHSELVKVVADPHDHKPLRLPTYPDIERTSILPFMATTQLKVAAPATGEPEVVAMLLRSPVAPLWFTQRFPIDRTQTLFMENRTSFGSQGAGAFSLFPVLAGETLSLRPLMSVVKTQQSVNWPTLSCLAIDSQGEFWFYAPPRSYMCCMFLLSASIGVGSAIISIETTSSLSTQDCYRYQLQMATGDSMAYSVPLLSQGCFFRFVEVNCTGAFQAAATITDFSVYASTDSGGTGQTPGYFHGLMPVLKTPIEFGIGGAIYNACRLNAVSALFANTTAVLDKEGSVEGAVISLSQYPIDILSTNFNYTTATMDIAACVRYAGLLEKGLYTFSLPDSQSTRFRDCCALSRYAVRVPLINLDSFDSVNIMRFTDYGTPDTSLFVTLDLHLEFRNTSMLWPIGVSTIELEAWHRSQISLQSMCPFFENPVHLATIANLARTAAVRLYPYIRPVAKAALGAARDKLLNMASNALSGRLTKPQIQLRSVGKTGSRTTKRPKPKAKHSRKI